MALTLEPAPIDLADMSEQDKADFVEGLTSGTVSGLTAQGMTVTGVPITWHDPIEADGKTGIYFDVQINVKYFGVDISVFECGVGFTVNGSYFVFLTGGTTQEAATKIIEEFLATLTWNE